MRCLILMTLLSALSAPALALSDVWTVDTDWPFADFDDLQTAIDAAADGDTIVIRKQCCPPPFADWFPDVVIQGRSLTLVAQGTRPLLTQLVIRDTPGTGAVIVRGIKATGTRVDDNAGVVWLEDCALAGDQAFASIAALRGNDNAALVVQRSSLLGADGAWGSILGWPAVQESSGVEATNTNLFLEGCTVAGGRGKGSFIENPVLPEVVSPTTPGMCGLQMLGGSLWLSGTSVAGGEGGSVGPAPSANPCLFSGGDGAPGVHLDGTQARVVDSLVQGGEGGVGWPGTCSVPPFMAQPGSPAAAWELVNATVTNLPGSAVELSIPSPVHEGGSVVATVSGAPGQLALVLLSLSVSLPGAIPQPFGALYVDGAPRVIILGLTGIDGSAALAATLGDLPPGVDGLELVLQGATCAAGACRVGGASVVSVLDIAL